MSFKLLADLVVLLLVLGTTAIVLLGWGNLTWRILGIEQPHKPSAITVWLGFCIVVGCIEIVHLFVPIDWKVALVFAVIGTLGCQLNAKSLAALKDNSSTDVLPASGMLLLFFNGLRRYPFRSCLAAIVVIVWCFRAMEVPTMYDSGLYHFGSIRWLNEYPIVPGLGNLHWRLALNQSYFGFLALLNIAPFWGKGYAAGGLFLLLLTAFTLLEACATQSKLWRWIFGGVLFSYLCLLSGPIANPMPDTAVALLQITIFILLYLNCVSADESNVTSVAQLQHLQIVLALLCLTIVTVKLSSVGFAIVCFGIVAALAFRSSPHKLPNVMVTKTVALLALFTFVHICRSYLLSGAPFFPSPIGSMWSLPWAVEFGVAQNESQLIYAWAKRPGVSSPSELASGFGWVGDWFAALPPAFVVLFAVSCLMLIIVAIHRSFSSKIFDRGELFIGLPLASALIFWFLSAPDIRFLGAVLILFFTWSFWLVARTIEFFDGQKNYLIQPITQRALYCAATAVVLGLFVRWSLIGKSAVYGWMPLPNVISEVHSNRSKLSAFVPTGGAQCWDSILPCTPLLHDGLRQEPLILLNQTFRRESSRFRYSLER